MSEDIYAKPDLSKKVRFQRGEKKEEKEEEEGERENEDVCGNIENVVIYDNCWTEESTPPPKPPDDTTEDQQKNTSVSPSEDIYAKPDLSKKVRFQASEKKEEEDEERRNTDIYQNINNVMTVVDPSPLKRTLPRAAGVFLGLLCLVLLAAVTVLLVLWIQDKSNWNTQRNQLSVERDKLQAMNNNLTIDRYKLQTINNNLTTERYKLQTINNNLTIERDELQTINNNLTTERYKLQNQLETHYCPDYWITFGKSCYLISNKKQPTIIPVKTWNDSKEFCEDRGAHLVIISNEKEQEFISSFNLRVWIGLTDEETEKIWKWVDGTKVNKTYWGDNQPDNHEPAENCAVIVTHGTYLNNWNDLSCKKLSDFVCEINLSILK